MKTLKTKFYWLKSRTMRCAAYLAVAPEVIEQLAEQLPVLQPYVPENLYRFLFPASVLLMVINRVRTTAPLADHK